METNIPVHNGLILADFKHWSPETLASGIGLHNVRSQTLETNDSPATVGSRRELGTGPATAPEGATALWLDGSCKT